VPLVAELGAGETERVAGTLCRRSACLAVARLVPVDAWWYGLLVNSWGYMAD